MTQEYDFVEMLLHSSTLFNQILNRYFILKKIPAICTSEYNPTYSKYLKEKVFNLKIIHHPDFNVKIAKLMSECCPYSYILEPDPNIPKILDASRQFALDLLSEPKYAEMTQEELDKISKQAQGEMKK